MNCMKCGRETAEDQVFCELCLDDMERHPVKPGTVVHIPSRAAEDEVRKMPRRKKPVVPLSEQIVRLRKRLIWARIAVAALLILCGILSFAISRIMIEWSADTDVGVTVGQNYSTVDAAGNIIAP